MNFLKQIACTLFLFPTLLFSTLDITYHVNPIFGSLQLTFKDYVVQGAVPIPIMRHYFPKVYPESKEPFWFFLEQMGLFPHCHLYVERKGDRYDRGNAIYDGLITETGLGKLVFHETSRDSNSVKMHFKSCETAFDANAFTRSYEMPKSYQDNYKNHKIEFYRKERTALMTLADGTKRHYIQIKQQEHSWPRQIASKCLGQIYRLIKEISPCGQKTLYEYKNDSLSVKKVNSDESKTFTSITITIDTHRTTWNKHDFHQFILTTSDGKKIYYKQFTLKDTYNLEKDIRFAPMKIGEKRRRPFLKEVEIEGLGVQKYEYDIDVRQRYWIKKISSPIGTNLDVHFHIPHYIPKDSPFNTNPEKESLYKVERIESDDGSFARYLYYESSTYMISRNKHSTKYCHNGKYLRGIEYGNKNSPHYIWENYVWKDYWLAKKKCYDVDGNLLKGETFTYDDEHQLIEHNILNEENEIHLTKRYEYNDRHLCTKEISENLTTTYTYEDDTNLLLSKKVGSIEEVYSYDKDNLLIEKSIIAPDLEKIEQYKRDPETKMILEKDNGLIPIFYEYNDQHQIVKESTSFATTEYGRDSLGRIIWKRFPLGAENTYQYNSHGNIITAKEVGTKEKFFTYNKMHLVESCSIHGRTSQNVYQDTLLSDEINFKGAKTSYEYNELKVCTTKKLPEIEVDGDLIRPLFHYETDRFGQITKEISPSGYVTEKVYDFLGNEIKTIFPDGSTIEHEYDSNNNIITTTLQDGSIVDFTYDCYGRCTSKTQGDQSERWSYSGILLESYTDKRGGITTYFYDEHGRKVAEEYEGRRKAFSFDEMGNLCTVRDGDLVAKEVYDIEGRVIQTSENNFHHITYEYNKEGQKVKAIKRTSQGLALDQFFYDKEGNLTKHIGPTGDVSLYLFDDWTREEIDPLGNRKVDTFDRQDRLIKTEKFSSTKELLFHQEIFYNLEGNISKKITNEHVVELEYDSMGRIIYQLESGKKETLYEYDVKGRLIKKINPNKIIFSYNYDQYDRKTWIESSDGTIAYEYIYDGQDLVEICDHIAGKSLLRKYSKYGEIIEETSFEGFKTSWFYDNFGRKKSIYLPDHSSIHYEYDGNSMILVTRKNADGETCYFHQYTKFDPNGHVEEEILPMGLGKVTTTRNILELPTSLKSPLHNIGLEFNENHFVTKMSNSITGDKEYDYDGLSQLTKENDKTYEFDGLGNSKEFEVNDLNQILSSTEESFAYDDNGNLTDRNNTKYSYDALDRLTSIEKENGEKTYFTYDPESRLVKKTCCQKTTYFLYDGLAEIGTISKDHEILQLKVLGLGVCGDIGGAIALELQSQVFIPLHDLQGNILAIVNVKGEITESYPMDAFGNEKDHCYLNPWRFSSKRHDDNLIYFGMRFYDPSLKRWLTPDPAGFTDSQNLYQFTLNSPINRLDQFGLYFQAIIDIDSKRYTSDDWYRNNFQYDINANIIVLGPKFFEDKIKDNPNDFEYVVETAAKAAAGAKNSLAFMTTQNGINTRYEEFLQRCISLHEQFPETIIFGIYNTSTKEKLNHLDDALPSLWGALITGNAGVYLAVNGTDILRTAAEHSRAFHSDSAYRTAHVFSTICDALQKYAPDADWLHIPHSEAGLQLNLAHNLLSKEHKEYTHKHCYILAMGPAERIPFALYKDAWNLYSNRDMVTGWGKNSKWFEYIVDPSKYKVEMLQSLETAILSLDHGFEGATYGNFIKNDLRGRINDKMGGLYDHRTR